MNKKTIKRVILSLLVVLVFLLCFFPTYIPVLSANDYSIAHDGTVNGTKYKDRYYNSAQQVGQDFNLYIKYDGTFIFERFGVVPNEEVTLLFTQGDFARITNSNVNQYVAYIDQKTADSTGYVRFQFRINSKFSFKENMYLGSNTTRGDEMIKIQDIKLGDLYLASGETNNILRVGKDLYHLQSSQISNADTVLSSIRYGGNSLYYCIDGLWYDLMDEKATSNDYLVKANSIDRSVSDGWAIRNYYIPSTMADALNGGNSVITVNRNLN